MRESRLALAIIVLVCSGYGDCVSSLNAETAQTQPAPGIVYRNPRVYNVDYSFEMFPDPNKIDRAKDLKVWIPIPREWDSQKAVEIISVEPEPHAEYADPEHGNRMFFWDFGKEPEKPFYEVKIKFCLESYEVHAEVDPNGISPYIKTSEDYALYTRSEQTVCITPKIKQMAKEAIGDEKNPYLQAKRILQFVGKKMRFKIHRHDRGVGTKCLLDFPVIDKKTGEEHYEGSCEQYSALFIALCRAAGIPARTVAGFIGWRPWIREEDLKLYIPIELEISPGGLAAAQHYMALGLHTWAEFYVPNYGWIPADAQTGTFGHLSNTKLIVSKGRDVQIGPQAPDKQSEGYGSQWVLLNNGKVDLLRTGVFDIIKIRTAKVKILHSDPFPVIKYFIYFCSTTVLAILIGGLAGYICLHKFKKYALIGLSSVVPLVGLALPVMSVNREKQFRCSKVSFVMLFWIFSVFLLWLLVFPVRDETDLISWSAWQTFCTIVVCILSVLVGWILAGVLCGKSWIKNKPIRVIIRTILFGIFGIVSAYMLGVWIMPSFT